MISSLRLARPSVRFPAALTSLGRIPFPALALGVCLLFAAVGVAVVDDYGVAQDELAQRRIAEANVDYIMGGRDVYLKASDWFYGIAFELPLLLVERVLGLQDWRSIFLSRHLISHWFYIAGGFCCGLLAWRMFNSRWLALLALLLFLLHPRLYAHSFFNSKDIPFLVMFVIALYFTHRAFRRDTAGAFVLLGVVVGLAVNLRPFALLLPPLILAMRGLDWWQSPGDGRRRILLTAGVFAAAALLAVYATHPYYWENPLRFIDGLQVMSRHPTLVDNLFRGQTVWSDAVPADYVPVSFGITTPPALLLLGVAGMAAALGRGWQHPGWVWRKGELRFWLLLLACLVLPVAAVIVLQSHIYNGWRQMYFLWGPFCLLAAGGLRFLWQWGRGPIGLRLTWRIALYGLAAAGLGGALYAIVSLHPHQQVYFNVLVNRAGPDELEQQYDLDRWNLAVRQGLEYLLERYPDTRLYVLRDAPSRRSWWMLPASERERIVLAELWDADFRIMRYMDADTRARTSEQGLAVYELRAYGSAYLTVVSPRRSGEAAYRWVEGEESLAARSVFDVYAADGVLYYFKDDCVLEDTETWFYIHLFPVNEDDLPDSRREYGFDVQNFYFDKEGSYFDGKCITQKALPDYNIARIRTGQQIFGGETLWTADLNLPALGRFREIEAGLAGLRPAAGAGDFDLYWEGDSLIYRREGCGEADVAARFYLHLFPAEVEDLPAARRQHGFVNRGFDFPEYGVIRGGQCLAAVPLPDYGLARIRTGQHISGRGELWRADFRPGQ